MELREYIAAGEAKAGSLTALGKMLDMSQPTISGVKSHKRGLTDKQLVQLANYINVSIEEMIRANNLAMGKNVDFWQHWGRAAALASFAFVTNFVTAPPAEANQINELDSTLPICNVHYVKYFIRQLSAKTKGQLNKELQGRGFRLNRPQGSFYTRRPQQTMIRPL